MKVRLTEFARQDLNQLIDELAARDLERAIRLNRGLELAFRVIATGPFRCPAVAESSCRNVRKKSWSPYLILFRPDPDEVLILRIVHERSDWASLV